MTARKPRSPQAASRVDSHPGPIVPDILKGLPLDNFIQNATAQILDVINGAVDESGMSKRQAAIMSKELLGRWRLTRMSNWDNGFMDEESPAFIEFTRKRGHPGSGGGSLHFGSIQVEIDWRPEQRQSRSGVAFTFEGHDEMDPTIGRGWAAVQADGTLKGQIYFHQGDDSAFWAKRQTRPPDQA